MSRFETGRRKQRSPLKKALLAQGGYPNGFELTMDHFASAPYSVIAQAIQADFASIGVKVQLLAGERKQVTTKMRARQFQMTLMSWFPDYLDPNSNAQAFCANPDDSDNSKLKIPAWRAHYFDKAQTDAVDEAAKELSDAKRLAIYAKMQRDFLQNSPFLMMLQQNARSTCCARVSPAFRSVRCPTTRTTLRS